MIWICRLTSMDEVLGKDTAAKPAEERPRSELSSKRQFIAGECHRAPSLPCI